MGDEFGTGRSKEGRKKSLGEKACVQTTCIKNNKHQLKTKLNIKSRV